MALHGVDGAEFEEVLLPANWDGQLPVALIDPVDNTGRVIQSMWLSGVEETIYRGAGQSKDSTLEERRAARIGQLAQFVGNPLLGRIYDGLKPPSRWTHSSHDRGVGRG